MRAVIFAGPSLPPGARPGSGPSIDWRPPVRQSELYRAALGRPQVIGVVDGCFEATPTVWHKEILWAMAEGIHVFGGASLGALRAAELDAFGMKGVGRVYEDFRDGVLIDDDEVAVLHGPEELGYPVLTEAMVNIRATLDSAVAAGILPPPPAVALKAVAKRLFYKERTYEIILEHALAVGLPERSLREFADWLPRSRVDRKRADALAVLGAIRAHLVAGDAPLRVSYELADTAAWQAARRSAEMLVTARRS
jgi:hypothetical protein